MPQIPTPDPADVFENGLHYLSRSLASIAQGDPDEVTGSAYFDASLRYRMLAVAALLGRADRRRFFGLLRKSGLVRLHFLQLVARGHAARRDRFCGSMNLPFIDALVAGDTDTAAAIAEASPDRHAGDLEYEDDYLRYRFLELLTRKIHRGEAPDLATLLDRWVEVLEGGEDAYLEVCRALHVGDPDWLDTAMTGLIDARSEQIAGWNKDISFDPELRLTEGAIFLNGLAVLRLADLLGMRTRRDYMYAPSIARAPIPLRLDPGSWLDPLAGL